MLSGPGAAELEAAVRHVAAADPALVPVIEAAGPPDFRYQGYDHFGALLRSIFYQQLAGKAAAAIHGRFKASFPSGITPEAVLAAPPDVFRAAGLSGAKAASILDLAARATDGRLPLAGVEALPDEEVIALLVQVRGVGRWTAEMFLIFQLRRLDVWPVGDYGVRNGWARAHGLAELPKPRELAALGEAFRPYRSVAALYCWAAVRTVLLTSN
ncbi:MAG: DNA-3-methyladenine glycosylase family protein [Candidatus Dormibacteraceae bacterium]